MPRAQLQRYTVHIFKPSGALLIKFPVLCTRADVAIRRAQKYVQSQSRLAHFYKFVPYLAEPRVAHA
jgi:hypothetical protein